MLFSSLGERGRPAPPHVLNRYKGDRGFPGLPGLRGRDGFPGMPGLSLVWYYIPHKIMIIMCNNACQ